MNLQTIIPTSHILEWRRHIHQHPELSHQEKETAAYIRAQLEKIGVDEIVSPTPTSLIATINGASPGKTVLFAPISMRSQSKKKPDYRFAQSTPASCTPAAMIPMRQCC